MSRTCFAMFALVAVAARPDEPPAKPVKPVELVAQLIDDTTLRLTLLDDSLELVTPYGSLRIPSRDVKRIDLMMRVPDEIQRKVEQAIAELSHPDFRRREIATELLAEQKERALPALRRAAESPDAETSRRAERLVEKLRETLPAERLNGKPHDVVTTEDSKIAGRIAAGVFRVRTLAFGEQNLRLADVRVLRSVDGAEPEATAALPDPGTLSNFGGKLNTMYTFQTVGNPKGGMVWGTDTYTTDSNLAAAAVHAGILQPGQRGAVRIVFIGMQPVYQGSVRNFVASQGFGGFNGFRFVR